MVIRLTPTLSLVFAILKVTVDLAGHAYTFSYISLYLNTLFFKSHLLRLAFGIHLLFVLTEFSLCVLHYTHFLTITK